MRIGFSGTRLGMTDIQKQIVTGLVSMRPGSTGVHGCCLGADADFHAICEQLEMPIVGWPGFPGFNVEDLSMRADLSGFSVLNTPMRFLRRNLRIVRDSDMMICTPQDKSGKGGTWWTIRCAQREKKSLIIVHFDGEIIFRDQR